MQPKKINTYWTRLACFIVRRGSPAESLAQRMCESEIRPGQVFMASDEEFESWTDDVIVLPLKREQDND